MNDRAELESRLKVLERQIAETRDRLPAHSVKPPVMMELLALEDEYDEIQKQLERVKESRNSPQA